MALAVAALLTPAAFLAAVLGVVAPCRRPGIGPASFAISSGIFSHWQVWLAAAVLLQFCARMLNRYGKRERCGRCLESGETHLIF